MPQDAGAGVGQSSIVTDVLPLVGTDQQEFLPKGCLGILKILKVRVFRAALSTLSWHSYQPYKGPARSWTRELTTGTYRTPRSCR